MRSLPMLRNITFILFACLTAVAFEAQLFASMGQALGEACDDWQNGNGYDCQDCNLGEGFEPDWGANGSCDFSELEPGPETDILIITYCQDLMSAFDETCETEYPEFLAQYYEWTMWETDPCYSASTSPSCWFTWANAGCIAGSYSTWEGSCDAVRMCECG